MSDFVVGAWFGLAFALTVGVLRVLLVLARFIESKTEPKP